jgi:hypothetical protein
VKATFPADHFATGVVVKFPVPRTTSGVAFEIAKGIQGHQAEYKQSENNNVAEWTIKKF